MWNIEIKTTFDAAHSLPDYKGPCAKMHGHTWTVEVSVAVYALDSLGMGMDFSRLKSIVREYDHENLNEIMYRPTAENLAQDIWSRVRANMDRRKVRGKILFVKVWESPGSCVTLKAMPRTDGAGR